MYIFLISDLAVYFCAEFNILTSDVLAGDIGKRGISSLSLLVGGME